MKSISIQSRQRDVRRGYYHRIGLNPSKYKTRRSPGGEGKFNGGVLDHTFENWMENARELGLVYEIDSKGWISIYLPEKLNYRDDYEITALNMVAIRKATQRINHPGFSLLQVNMDGVRELSTSAAIVLAAELSRWEERLRNRLNPNIDTWDPSIKAQLKDLGFFGLFKGSPIEEAKEIGSIHSTLKMMKYIKGGKNEHSKHRELKAAVRGLIGDNVDKWTNLASGITEAIQNVGEHAYKNGCGIPEAHQKWYMGGSLDKSTNSLRIVFYDQGIGIPKSLPASDNYEKALDWLSAIPILERKKDEVLLRAAVKYNRTSSGQADKGKGLQDFLDFIRERKSGYLSILSGKGLYKFTLDGSKSKEKSEAFRNPIEGTLIIWKVQLTNLIE